MEPTAATSPSSLPQSSSGRLEVSNVFYRLIAAHDDLQQIFRARVRQFAHAEVIDNEQRNGGTDWT